MSSETTSTDNIQHGFFLIIPAFIADDPDLDDATKMLFGRLSALSNKYGYCWASDEALAEMSKCKYRVISDRLKDLENKGYIHRETQKEGMYWKRKIYPLFDIQKNSTKSTSVRDRDARVRDRDARPCAFEARHCAEEEDNNINNITNKQLHAQPAARLRPKDALSFNFSTHQFEGISQEDRNSWNAIYPHLNLDTEIAKATEWLKSNPSKSDKKLWRKYLTGWFQRANDAIENKKAFKVASKSVSLQKESVLSYFKNGESYNGAICTITAEGICFDRGMNHGEVKFNAFGFEDRLKELADRFQIKTPERN